MVLRKKVQVKRSYKGIKIEVNLKFSYQASPGSNTLQARHAFRNFCKEDNVNIFCLFSLCLVVKNLSPILFAFLKT
uniref:Uncharacterized protein n=1 Tax=Helianthus annuus TaxID=4232 RepID=A0A251U6R7_HELAN